MGDTKFEQAFAWLLVVLNYAWDLAFSTIPVKAMTMIIILLIISIVINRLIAPMIGRATGGMIDQAMYGTDRAIQRKQIADSYEKRERAREQNQRLRNRNRDRRNPKFMGPHTL